MASIPRIDPDLVINYQFSEVTFEYTERDVALYALGVGTIGNDAVDPVELPFLYNPNGRTSIKVLPTFAVCFCYKVMDTIASISGLHYDPKLLLHVAQHTEIYKPLPTRAQVLSSVQVSGLEDKGSAALVELETISRDAGSGDVLCLNRYTFFLRGAGGFSLSPQPYSYSKRTTNLREGTPYSSAAKLARADAAPDFVYEDQTHPSQALLYSLSGDYNDLQSNPDEAAKAGFERPILHGLCTMGYAVRAILRCYCNGDPTRVQSFEGRFLSHVYPGEKLTTEIWFNNQQSRATYHTSIEGRYIIVGDVVLARTPSRL